MKIAKIWADVFHFRDIALNSSISTKYIVKGQVMWNTILKFYKTKLYLNTSLGLHIFEIITKCCLYI